MAINQRPDTPLAATPEPTPAQSISKYQATADAAIQQINNLSRESMPQPAAPAQAPNPLAQQQ